MPTYTFRCQKCGSDFAAYMSIREYCAAPPAFVCCGQQAERFFEVVPGMALHNALAGDRHYDGLRATDGADISTREKHRAYMKAHGLTTADDFKQTWSKAADERAARLAGKDSSRRVDVERAIAKLET